MDENQSSLVAALEPYLLANGWSRGARVQGGDVLWVHESDPMQMHYSFAGAVAEMIARPGLERVPLAL